MFRERNGVKNGRLTHKERVWCAGDPIVDGIERSHCQNTGKQIRNFQLYMEKACQHPGKATADKCAYKRKPWIHSPENQTRSNSTSQREGAVHGKIRKVQNVNGDIDAQRHNSENQSLF